METQYKIGTCGKIAIIIKISVSKKPQRSCRGYPKTAVFQDVSIKVRILPSIIRKQMPQNQRDSIKIFATEWYPFPPFFLNTALSSN